MENRENMILRMTRRLNEAILKFIMTARLRTIGATLLGALAGLSLTATIIPSAMEFTGAMDSFSARWQLGGFAAYSMIIWGLGARSAQKSGDKKMGAIILGSVGLACGLIFTGVGISTEMNVLMTGGGCGAALRRGRRHDYRRCLQKPSCGRKRPRCPDRMYRRHGDFSIF